MLELAYQCLIGYKTKRLMEPCCNLINDLNEVYLTLNVKQGIATIYVIKEKEKQPLDPCASLAHLPISGCVSSRNFSCST